MLAGLSPYPDGYNTQIIFYASTRPPLPLSKVDPPIDLSSGLEQLIYDTMARDPARRPQTAGEFIERLDSVTQSSDPSSSWPVIHTTVGHASGPKPVQSRHIMGPDQGHDLRMETQLFHSVDEDHTENIPLDGEPELFAETATRCAVRCDDGGRRRLLRWPARPWASAFPGIIRPFGAMRPVDDRVDSRTDPIHSIPSSHASDPAGMDGRRRHRQIDHPRKARAVAETLDAPGEGRTFYWIGLIMVTITSVWCGSSRIGPTRLQQTEAARAMCAPSFSLAWTSKRSPYPKRSSNRREPKRPRR